MKTGATLWLCLILPALGQAAPVEKLPAYAHNDYLNSHPLNQALQLGYRGVEADYYVVQGKLLLSHDPEDKSAGKSLEEVYLDPLRRRIREFGGSVYGDGEVFLLNIESKEPGAHTYSALHQTLKPYEDLLCTVRDNQLYPGPVQVILVGWHPSLDALNAQPVRYAAVQQLLHELPVDHAKYPAHLLKMITLEYDLFSWKGRGRAPDSLRRALVELRAATSAVEGRWARAIHAPLNKNVYGTLLRAGVDLIGTTDIERSPSLLARP